jgi:hypothetical protein
MRMWMLMAATVGMAAAQEGPKAAPEKPKAEEKKAEDKLPAPLQQKKFEALDRALRQGWQAKAPAPPEVCAIPLLNVLKPAGAGTVEPDPMIIVPRGPMAGKDQVKVPAPSCDEVKK